MKFAFLMTADYARWRGMSPEQSQALESQVRAFNDQLGDAGVLVTTEGLEETARHVHFHTGHDPDIQDGPVTAEPERVAAFWVIDVPDMDAALGWARQAPVTDGAIEVRPIG
jgi:hypothetical protein